MMTWKFLCQISWSSSHPIMFRFRKQWPSLVKCPFWSKLSCMSPAWPTIASYKEYHTRAALATLSDLKLKTAGVETQEDRKLVMAALRKAGYGYQSERRKKVEASRSTEPSGSVSKPRPSTSSTQPTAVEILVRLHIIPPKSAKQNCFRRRRRPNVRENVRLKKQMNSSQMDLQTKLSRLLH